MHHGCLLHLAFQQYTLLEENAYGDGSGLPLMKQCGYIMQ